MKKPKVFIIILNYNGGDDLIKCLDSVYKLSYLNKEVVVVDNDSGDDSFEFARKKFRTFNFIKNRKNFGFAKGNNVAIRWALEKMADFIFLLNNDAQIEKDALDKMVRVMQRNKELGIVSPIIYKNNKKEVWFAKGKINWLKMRTEHISPGKHDLNLPFYNTDYITGCAMLIKSEVFAKIGLFDERFFLYYEDADLSYRAEKKGFALGIVCNARVYHLEKSLENQKKIYWLVLSGVLFFKKNTPRHFKIWTFFYLLARKIKNIIDVQAKKTKESLQIREAYKDVKKFLQS